MTDNIKLPPYPEGLCLREDIEDYAREAVRLNAQAVPEISTEHGPWIESTLHEGETYCARCLVRSVFAGHKKCEPHAVSVPAAPPPAAQQGEIAWPAIPATVRRDVTMLAGYAEGSKSAEIVNTVRRVINWLNADRIAAQAQDAAPAAQGEPIDPLQGAANWLLEAIGGCNIRTLEWHLMIDSNRAERLLLAARAAQQKGASNG